MPSVIDISVTKPNVTALVFSLFMTNSLLIFLFLISDIASSIEDPFSIVTTGELITSFKMVLYGPLLPPITLYKISRSVTIPVINGFSEDEYSDLTRIEDIPTSFIIFTASATIASSGRVTSLFSIRSSTQCLDEAKYARIFLLMLYLVIDPSTVWLPLSIDRHAT